MKTLKMTKKLMAGGRNIRPIRKKPVIDPDVPLFPDTSNQGLIQWPTPKQILDVSKKLTEISRMGARAEAKGDYFNSGDLAYQMQEIIRATSGLFERGRRLQARRIEDE